MGLILSQGLRVPTVRIVTRISEKANLLLAITSCRIAHWHNFRVRGQSLSADGWHWAIAMTGMILTGLTTEDAPRELSF